VYYRRRLVVVAAPVLVMAGALAWRGTPDSPPGAGGDTGAHQDESAAIVVPSTSVHPHRAVAPSRSTLEPAPVVPAGASRFVPVPPATLLATRTAGPVLTTVPVLGRTGMPRKGVSAVALEVVVSGAAGRGQIDVWSGAARPAVPVLTLAGAGDTGAGFTVVALSGDAALHVRATTGASVRVEVQGYFAATPRGAAAGRLMTVPGTRLLDTTVGTGALNVTVAGAGGVPVTGAAAVLLQLTARDGDPPGRIAAWPTGALSRATVLTVPAAGWTASNLAIVTVGRGGAVSVRSSSVTHLAVDILGWVTDASARVSTDGLFQPLPASRVVDTRAERRPLSSRVRRDVRVGARGGLPPFGAQAVLGRVGAVAATDGGAVTVYAAGTPRPTTPTLHTLGAGRATAGTVWLRLGPRGGLSAWSETATDLVVDVAGYVVGRPAAPYPIVSPTAPTVLGADPWPAFDGVIEGFRRAYGVAAVSVAVAKDGRVAYVRGYGAPVASLFRYASISKVLTAATVLGLVDAGRLSLDAPVMGVLARTLPTPPGADARLGAVTVRQLLDHTSGLARWPDPFFAQGVVPAPASCSAAAAVVVGRPLASTPGTRFAYNNANFCLLTLVAEAVTGQPFLDALTAQVLGPRNVHDVTLGHTAVAVPGQVVHPTGPAGAPGVGWFMESLEGAGGLVGTPVDLVRIVDGLDPRRPGNHLLSPAAYAAMLAPEPGGWGLGVRLFGPGGYGHTGSLPSTRDMTVHQADGITWAITTTGTFGDHGSVLYGVMSRALATVTAWPSWDLNPDLP
jgi:CubicO group peptidase (beta-lactamase class C family)